jgi:hypothetical protein
MQDPDEWRRVGVHWHGYVEQRDGSEQVASARYIRLQRPPDAVLVSPDAAADWIAETTGRHAQHRPVRLIGPSGGAGHMGDEAHLAFLFREHAEVAARGDSVYFDFPTGTDRLHLWCEAVTPDQCQEVHEPQEQAP